MSESKQLKTMQLSIKEARDLHGDITKLLLVLQTLQESTAGDESPGKIEKVEISGGNW